MVVASLALQSPQPSCSALDSDVYWPAQRMTPGPGTDYQRPYDHQNCRSRHSSTSSRPTRLYRVQNNAARIVLEAPRRSHASPLLRTLHWLPVQQRIDYKVALLTFKVRSTSTPSYLRLLIQDREHGRNLRSTTTTLCQPFTTTTFAKRAFR